LTTPRYVVRPSPAKHYLVVDTKDETIICAVPKKLDAERIAKELNAISKN
jgi:hypothetical protein